MPHERLSELSAEERARLGRVWSDLPPHIFDQMVDRLARLRLARELDARPAHEHLPD